MVSQTEELSFRRFKVRSMPTAKGWRAVAFRGCKRATEFALAPSREEAIASVKAELAAAYADELAARSEDGFPTSGWVLAAFQNLRVSNLQDKMLQAHRRAPAHILTATQLAKAGGSANYGTANNHYGQLGRALAEEMEWEPPLEPGASVPVWTFTLAVEAVPGEAQADTGEWRWKLRPQVAEALALHDLNRTPNV